MAFYPGLTPLRDILADLYPAASIAQAVVGEAGLPEQLIDFSGSGMQFWQSILSVAHSNNQVQDVIDVARKHFAQNERLIEAEEIFHSTPAPELPTDQADTSTETGSANTMNVSVGNDNSGIIARDINNANVVNTGDISGDGNIVVADSDNLVQQAKGSNIAQAGPGGTATVDDRSSHSVFDQRGQQVDTQYNIAGDYNPATVQDRAAAIVELRKLLDEITQARAAGALDVETATDAGYQITKVLNQADTPEPDKSTMLDHLDRATQVIATAASSAGLVTAIAEAVRMVQRIF